MSRPLRSPLAPHTATASELQARAALERTGTPFLVLRDDQDTQVLVPLDTDQPLTLGRRTDNDVVLAWDDGVSRLHARLERIGQDWTVSDDGLSHNGTYVNDVRLTGRRRLMDGDLIRCSDTLMAFRAAGGPDASVTRVDRSVVRAVALSPAQRRVLVALCRPLTTDPPARLPATNKQIAEDLVLSLDAIKAHLRALFRLYELDHLPQNEKRTALADRALASGAIRAGEG